MQIKTRVRFIDSAATTTTQYVRGQVYDLEAGFARSMVECGAAAIEEPEQDQKRWKRDAVPNHNPTR